MTGVPRHIAEHHLNVREGCSPVRQKKRGQAADRNQAIQEEVGKLVEAGIMKEMPFGLRNAGETYQRLVDKAFHKRIGRNLEVYVDDLVIKIRTEDEIVKDIEETYKTLREINMKLNPKKCTFGVEEGMFLGYKVNTKGLKVCPDKVDAVLGLPSPKCLKDVQKLNGKLVSLNRFLAKSAEKSLPFFKNLKKCTKKSDFHWTTKAKEAFKQMKELIVELPMLIAPIEKEEHIVYLAAAKETKYGAFFDKTGAGITGLVELEGLKNRSAVNLSSQRLPKKRVKSLALKAKVTREQTSNDSDSQGESDEHVDEDEAEEFNLIARNFRKFFRKDKEGLGFSKNEKTTSISPDKPIKFVKEGQNKATQNSGPDALGDAPARHCVTSVPKGCSKMRTH
ncbi:reverse transcriptase domain-containing protein [Tanacetum coccineum]|uniref:Reverse transcriptase domain-containing protein n=1 Tax=Tanacetum coccineum TaxID=301880 RepID=A0ABQ5EDC5_9ASTR